MVGLYRGWLEGAGVFARGTDPSWIVHLNSVPGREANEGYLSRIMGG